MNRENTTAIKGKKTDKGRHALLPEQTKEI